MYQQQKAVILSNLALFQVLDTTQEVLPHYTIFLNPLDQLDDPSLNSSDPLIEFDLEKINQPGFWSLSAEELYFQDQMKEMGDMKEINLSGFESKQAIDEILKGRAWKEELSLLFADYSAFSSEDDYKIRAVTGKDHYPFQQVEDKTLIFPWDEAVSGIFPNVRNTQTNNEFAFFSSNNPIMEFQGAPFTNDGDLSSIISDPEVAPKKAEKSHLSEVDKKERLNKEPRNFNFIIRTVERILDEVFTGKKEKPYNEKMQGKYLDAFNKFLKDYDQNSKTLRKGFAEAGKEIYDAIGKLKKTGTEKEIEEELSKCYVENLSKCYDEMEEPIKQLITKIQELLKPMNQDMDSVLKNCEKKEEYTYANFKNCTLSEEIFRRLILINIAKDFIITQSMDAEFQRLQGINGMFILSVLGGKRILLENQIRLLDFNCESTKHIQLKLIELEKELRKKLKAPDKAKWLNALEESLHKYREISRKTSSVSPGSTHSPFTGLTRSQTPSSFGGSIKESKTQTIHKKPQIKANNVTRAGKERALNGKVDGLFCLVKYIYSGDKDIKDRMEHWLTQVLGFLLNYWPHLVPASAETQKRHPKKASKGNKDNPFTEEQIDDLSKKVTSCLHFLNRKMNVLKHLKSQGMVLSDKKDLETNLGKRPLVDPQKQADTGLKGSDAEKKFKSKSLSGDPGGGDPT